MSRITRRSFVLSAGALSAASALGWSSLAKARTGARVVVIGGGIGGATCAKYLRRLSTDIEVTLVERDTQFMTCPFSNAVLGGLYDMDFITHDYEALSNDYGVKVMRKDGPAGRRCLAAVRPPRRIAGHRPAVGRDRGL